MEIHTFTISNISCGHCTATIEKELKDIRGVAVVNGSPHEKTITVEWHVPATVSQIEAKLIEIGYPAST